MKTLFTFLLFTFPFLLSAQTKMLPPGVEWQKAYGGTTNGSVIATSDHGFLAVGQNGSDAFIIKVNNAGDLEWSKTYGGTGVESFKDVIEVSNGDFICVGATSSQD